MIWEAISKWCLLVAIGCNVCLTASTRTLREPRHEDSQPVDFIENEHNGRILSIEDFGAIPDAEALNAEHVFLEFFPDVRPVPHMVSREWQLENVNRNQTELCLANTAAFNKALLSARSGDVVLVPDGKSYTFAGGILGQFLDNVTIDVSGSIHFVHDLEVWPFHDDTERKLRHYLPGLNIVDSKGVRLTSSSTNPARAVVDLSRNEVYLDKHGGVGGIINGNGKTWWDDAIFGRLPYKDGDARPRLVHVQSSVDILVENLTLLNSPFWTLTVEAVRAEIRNIIVLVDRKYETRTIKFNNLRANRSSVLDEETVLGKFPFPLDIPDWLDRRLHQPQDLNTDGIDTRGTDIFVHNCIVQNADDSVAVKPPINGNLTTALNGTFPYSCTRNVTVENVVLTGFGASIGSVGPSKNHACVDGVVFRNVTMPGTGKGIYIKSDSSNCTDGQTSQISNILYEDVRMSSPTWWPIWIGPQQQHQPHSGLEGKCPLLYPLPGSKHCPRPDCATFENITLRNIFIDEPILSPGVILGNATNPMRNIVFDNVTVANSKWKPFAGRWPFHEKRYPYRGKYQCLDAEGTCRNCDPTLPCVQES